MINLEVPHRMGYHNFPGGLGSSARLHARFAPRLPHSVGIHLTAVSLASHFSLTRHVPAAYLSVVKKTREIAVPDIPEPLT